MPDPLTPEEVTEREIECLVPGFMGNGRVRRLIATIRDRERERDEFKAACVEAENAIRACPALKEWGPSTAQHLPSRVNNLCRMYDSAVYTITELAKERDELQRKLDAYRKLDEPMWEGAGGTE